MSVDLLETTEQQEIGSEKLSGEPAATTNQDLEQKAAQVVADFFDAEAEEELLGKSESLPGQAANIDALADSEEVEKKEIWAKGVIENFSNFSGSFSKAHIRHELQLPEKLTQSLADLNADGLAEAVAACLDSDLAAFTKEAMSLHLNLNKWNAFSEQRDDLEQLLNNAFEKSLPRLEGYLAEANGFNENSYRTVDFLREYGTWGRNQYKQVQKIFARHPQYFNHIAKVILAVGEPDVKLPKARSEEIALVLDYASPAIRQKLHDKISNYFLKSDASEKYVQEIINQMLKSIYVSTCHIGQSLADFLDGNFANFKTVEDQILANFFVRHLDKFSGQPLAAENVKKAISYYSAAQSFISAAGHNPVWRNELWVENALVEAKEFIALEDLRAKGEEGFSETNPYENHIWRLDAQQIKLAKVISELLKGTINSETLPGLGVDFKEVTRLLAEINKKITAAYQNFLVQVKANPHMTEEEKQAFLAPGSGKVKINSLLDNLQSFVSRYYVGLTEGDISKLPEILENPEVFISNFKSKHIGIVEQERDTLRFQGSNGKNKDKIAKREEEIESIKAMNTDLADVLEKAFETYLQAYQYDIPLYDKLYQEFDALRKDKRYPLEVYLGRDGIYAWIGRRAQDVARRRSMGPQRRKELKEQGEVIAIHPQYTVYPSYFRDHLNYETKRQLLAQEQISPETDPLLYDTGFSGSIPEQMMKIQGFAQAEIEQRIKLLYAGQDNRRAKGIAENPKRKVINIIEEHPKGEMSAEGIIIDEKTGKALYIAKPTNPEEQLHFMMIKQAIARHYWLQERLHHN